MLERVCLHIGVAKTGTKTLQLAMGLNRDLLHRHGFVYPVLTAQPQLALALYALSEGAAVNEDAVVALRARLGLADLHRFRAFLDEFPSRVADALAVPGVHTAILSSENCSTALSTVKQIARLHDLLSPLSRAIQIVVYLRRQDELATSVYSSAMKAGRTHEFELRGHFWFDYLTLLDNWAEIFGSDSLVIRIFEPRQMHPAGLLADFSSAIGFEQYDQLQRPPDQNTSIDVYAAEFLRRFNAQVPELQDARPNHLRGEINRAIEAISTKDRLTPSREAAMSLLDEYAASNAEMARKYLDRADGVLFIETPPDRPERLPALDVDKAVEIAAKLWQWQERRYHRQNEDEQVPTQPASAS